MANVSKIYSHAGLAGCVSLRKAKQTGTRVGVYNGEQAGFDTDGSQWSTVCEEHESIVAHSTLKLAIWHSVDPAGWCEECTPRAGR